MINQIVNNDYEKESYQLPELIKGAILVERWTYDLGANRFIRYLFFQNGELQKIERDDKLSEPTKKRNDPTNTAQIYTSTLI